MKRSRREKEIIPFRWRAGNPFAKWPGYGQTVITISPSRLHRYVGEIVPLRWYKNPFQRYAYSPYPW